jgi:anaerobic magnesium-protoporphyrin IX monomethyl ester cyclase
MKLTLMHPPIDDPTLPYHSLAYLAGHMAHNGFTDVSMRDINVEYVNYCLERETIHTFYEEGARYLRELEGRSGLNFAEQEEYYSLWSASRIDSDKILEAVHGMRDKEAFLDFDAYLKNVNLLQRYFNFLGALSYPAEINNFRQMTRARYSIYNLRDLLNAQLAEKICYSFTRFFDERLTHDAEFQQSDCFGISIVYDHQLFHSLYLARALKKRWPDKQVLLGGTSISQLYKQIKDRSQMKHFFSMCDAIVVGEGETAICEIAASEGDLNRKGGFPNTITYDRERDEVRFPQSIHYENVQALGTPVYEHPWHLYLSPEKGINYAPTRGCYWNRCTFCDYGLNTDSPTSPWRERKIEQVVVDLQAAVSKEQVKYVYFAVDVMAPSYIERLSDAMVDAGLDMKWSAEMRLEKIFSAERCKKMARSGCVCISFGMESGNQRILDLIDKGTKVGYMGETMKNFSSAGIAVQLMAFTDFPTETPAEKKETFDFIKQYDDYWSTGGMGTFLLTGTSMIAKNPEKFGIKVIETEDADIARAIAYRIESGGEQKVLMAEDCDESFNADGGVFLPVLGRPWAGGTDTLHTMIYYNAYGNKFFRENPLFKDAPNEEEEKVIEDSLRYTLVVPGKLNESPFDISQILENREPYQKHITRLLQVPIEPTYTSFCQWYSTLNPLPGENVKTYWITTGHKSVKLDKLVYRIISVAAERQVRLGEILNNFEPEMRDRLLDFLRKLEGNGLLMFKDPDDAGKEKMNAVYLDEKSICKGVKVMPQGLLVESARQ